MPTDLFIYSHCFVTATIIILSSWSQQPCKFICYLLAINPVLLHRLLVIVIIILITITLKLSSAIYRLKILHQALWYGYWYQNQDYNNFKSFICNYLIKTLYQISPVHTSSFIVIRICNSITLQVLFAFYQQYMKFVLDFCLLLLSKSRLR